MPSQAAEPFEGVAARLDGTSTRRVFRLGLLTAEPVACDAVHARDPEAAAVYPAVADSLVYLDSDGATRPGLAHTWRRIDPLTMEFDLREGVRFHNGDRFTADDVVATMRAQLSLEHLGFNGRAVLSTLAECVKVNDYCVRLRTHRPDGVFLYRLPGASAIYPRSILESKGSRELMRHPIGTGGYVFESWQPDHEIVLSRNADHWSKSVQIDELRLPIIDRKDWIDGLRAGHLDAAWGLDPHDVERIEADEPLIVKRRDTGLSHWFLLSLRGPLADRRVRLALNYAVHRHLLCNVVSHGYAQPQSALARTRQAGDDPALAPYPYDPEQARQLLREAGHGKGFTLRGLVCESSSSLYQLLRVFLGHIGVELIADVVPRPTWLARVVARKLDLGEPYEGDFALVDIANLFAHGLLQHELFLHSRGPFSIIDAGECDRHIRETSGHLSAGALNESMRAFERYVYDEALLLFTIRQQLCCVVRDGFDMRVSASGQPTCDSLWTLRQLAPTDRAMAPRAGKIRTDVVELQRLLDATSFPGTLYETEPSTGPVLARLWRNMELHQARWQVQTEQMLRTMVHLVSANINLDNVLRSTNRVAILGVTKNGRVLFENSGYRNVVGHGGDVPLARILYDDDELPAWQDIKTLTDASGVCNEIVNVRVSDTESRRIFMSVTPALNENKDPIGYVVIATDHSKEEEQQRIRQEVELARRIQSALLPTIDERDSDYLSAVMLPAEEVGGDYYDLFTDDNGHKWYGIGDVSGHGVTSGLMMLMGRSIIRALIRQNPDITMNEMLSTLNRVLYEDIQQMGDSYHFTVSLIKSLGAGDYVAAGAHEDIIVHRAATGECERIQLTGIWVGFIPEVSGMFEEVTFHMEPGDTMVLYTDGFIEAEAEDGTMWESRRFVESIKRHAHLPAEDMRRAIVDDVGAFMDVQHDDMTMMIIRRSQ